MEGTENQNTSLQFSGWCPVIRGLARAFAWGTGALQDELHRLKEQSDLRRHDLTWNGSPSQRKFWTVQERRLARTPSLMPTPLLCLSSFSS